MDKEICFLINDNTLFLDKVLVAFNDAPIFFVCCDNNGCYYFALCTDFEKLEYIIVMVSLQTIYRVITQKIEMREPFVVAKHFWEVKAGASVHEDEVQYLDGKHMDLEVLPYPNAMYETINKSDEAYVEKIKTSYFHESEFVALDAFTRDCSDISPFDVSSINLQPVTQYIELSNISESPFSGWVKAFKYSYSEKTDTYFYEDQMVQREEFALSQKVMDEILFGRNPSFLEAA